MSKTENLFSLLDKASYGKASDIKQFLETLLESQVFIPLIPDSQSKPVPVEVGGNTTAAMGYLTINLDGREFIPIFSDEKLILEWMNEELGHEKKEFKTILNSLSQDSWLHLNPGQNVGKEFSPWEIEMLRQGSEALDELVTELTDVSDLGVEIDTMNVHSELQGQFISVLEIYQEIKEGFLISIREGEDAPWKPLLGILREGLKKDKVEYIREELRAIAESSLEDGIDLIVIDDLANADSFHSKLFEDVKPFYVAQEELKHQSFSVKNLIKEVTKKKS